MFNHTQTVRKQIIWFFNFVNIKQVLYILFVYKCNRNVLSNTVIKSYKYENMHVQQFYFVNYLCNLEVYTYII